MARRFRHAPFRWQGFRPMFRFFENLIDPYCDYPQEDRPPRELWPFLTRYLKPFRKVFVATGLVTIVVAAIEIWLIAYIGRLVDVLASSQRETFWRDNGLEMVLVAVFLLTLRPLLQMLEAVEKQTEQMGRSELDGRLQAVKQLIQARLN